MRVLADIFVRIPAFAFVVAELVGVFVAGIAGLVVVVVGAWDGAVWLFKADWRTTEFEVPIAALKVFLVAAAITMVMGFVATNLSKFAEAMDPWDPNNE